MRYAWELDFQKLIFLKIGVAIVIRSKKKLGYLEDIYNRK